jgi:intracellular multiplication protein IcmK
MCMRRLFNLVVVLSGLAAFAVTIPAANAQNTAIATPPLGSAQPAAQDQAPVLEEVASPPTGGLGAVPAETAVAPPPAANDPAQPMNAPAVATETPDPAMQAPVAPPPATAQAPVNDSVVAPPILPPPTAMPPQPAADGSAAEDMANNPGMNLSTDEAALQALENDPAVLEENLRQEAYDASVNGLMPLRPGEIKSFLRTYDETQAAVESPLDAPPKPEMGITTVSLDPGTAPAEINLAVGNVTTLNIVDISGQPWPIQDIGWAGNFEILQPEQGSHVLRITPISQYAYGNVSVRLVGLNTPIIMTLKTNKDNVYYRLDIRIPDFGPKATPPIIDAGITTKAGDKTLTSVLEGVMPEGAEKMVVEGIDARTTAYALDGQTFVRTPYTLLSPAWNSSVKSADGMNVYSIEATPVLLLSDRGKMVRATLREVPEENNEF